MQQTRRTMKKTKCAYVVLPLPLKIKCFKEATQSLNDVKARCVGKQRWVLVLRLILGLI